MKEFIIGPNEAGQRLDKYIHKCWKDCPSSLLYKLLRKKSITVNGKKADASVHLNEGDLIRIFVSDDTFLKFNGQTAEQTYEEKRMAETGITVLYRDRNIMLLNKPAGILSQKAEAADYSCADFCRDYCIREGILSLEELKTFKPGICSRLDRNTSGIMTAGISFRGLQEANALIYDHAIGKYYLAIVKGKMKEKKGMLFAAHRKNHEKNQAELKLLERASDYRPEAGSHLIQTGYAVVAEGRDASLLLVKLVTGQTHQIRAHFAAIGHPLAGDMKYGDADWNRKLKEYACSRQMLHAYKLVFPNIEQNGAALKNLSGRTFYCPVPEDMKHTMEGLEILWQPGTAED